MDNRNAAGNQPDQNGQRALDKNETLKDADTVADYGRSEQSQQSVDDLEQRHGMQSDRQGNSSIPMDNEDTLGNP